MPLVSHDHKGYGSGALYADGEHGLSCHLGLGDLLPPGKQGNGQTVAKPEPRNVSCLTCLSQLKCLHLKQSYSIVNHNELQSLRSLPARHKTEDIGGGNSLRKSEAS